MMINSDIKLKGNDWNKVIDGLSEFFSNDMQKNYNIFFIATSIGILYNKQKEINDNQQNSNEFVENKIVPRNVLAQHHNDMDVLFQTAILTTDYSNNLDRKQKLDLAFNEDSKIEFKKVDFLLKFANFGISILANQIDDNKFRTMDNIYEFIKSIYYNTNFDIYNDDDIDESLIDL